MAEEVGESAVVEQSEVLSTEEVNTIVEGTPEEVGEAILPSDEVEFVVPEKFKGKSVEDVIKSYQELEKFKGKPTEEGGGQESQEEKVEESTEESSQKKYEDYRKSYEENGELSEEDYSELEKQGITREKVDDELEFLSFKKDKAMNVVLEPLGGGKDKFKEVAAWMNSNMDKADIEAFNTSLASSDVLAQRALLAGKYSQYDASRQTEGEVLHTNAPQGKASKGYKTQEEFFKDVGSEEYKNNPAYRKAVEAKMSRSSVFD